MLTLNDREKDPGKVYLNENVSEQHITEKVRNICCAHWLVQHR